MLNLYGPNNDDPEFFSNVFDSLETIDADQVVIGGDFNKVLDLSRDKRSRNVNNDPTKAANVINNFIDQQDWVDIWRYLHHENDEFTWHHRKPIVFTRIDYFIIPQFSIPTVTKCEIMPNHLSDHSFVLLELSFQKALRGKRSLEVQHRISV